MKKVVLGIAVLLLVVLGISVFNSSKREGKKETLSASVTPTKVQVLSAENIREKKFLFVPYWGQTAQRIPESFGDELVYFGIAPGENGIDKEETGYLGLDRFEAISEGRDTLLALRMIEQERSFAILKDKALQKRIIDDSIAAVKQHNFDGIVLDLEISSLPFASITNQMNTFVEEFSKAVKKEKLSFSMMFYGDTFYRLRPYDTIILSKHVDYVMIMAYDFHKAKVDPGPNFPLSGKEVYGYDFMLMVHDFLNIVPKEKLVIVFGMFGYDWRVDEDEKSLAQAKAVTLTVAKKQFLTTCIFRQCKVQRSEISAETTASYIDSSGNKHIVWFEDEESVAKKTEFLKEKGINMVGYWAYSYF